MQLTTKEIDCILSFYYIEPKAMKNLREDKKLMILTTLLSKVLNKKPMKNLEIILKTQQEKIFNSALNEYLGSTK